MSEDKFKTVGEGLIRASNKRIVRKTRKVEDSKIFRRASLAVGLLIVFATLVVLAIAITISVKRRQAPEEGQVSKRLENLMARVPQTATSKEEIVIDEEEVAREAEKLKRISDGLVGFMNASSADDVIPFINDGESFRDGIETYLDLHSLTPFRVFRSRAVEFEGKSYKEVYARTGSSTRALIIDNETGLIDWESFAGTNSHRFTSALLKAQDEEGLVARGLLTIGERSEYYNYDYSDREEWMSTKFVFPLSKRSVTCYVRNDSEIAAELNDLFSKVSASEREGGYLSVVLRLKAKDEESAQRKQLEVFEVMSNSWFLPGQPKIAVLNGLETNEDTSLGE